MGMRKQRNRWKVVTVTREPGERPKLNYFPAVATEEKAKELLESLDSSGFVQYDGNTVWQRSMGSGIFPPRWIDRR